MTRVVILATGGTIASVNAEGGGAVASRSAEDLLSGWGADDVDVEAKDVMSVGSYLMTFGSMRELARAARRELQREDVAGVVITHGTDTIEETGALLDAIHDSPKPLVLTGAQRAADHPAPDGPENLRRAVQVAASPIARGRGALLVFGDDIFGLTGTRKVHTLAAAPFDTQGSGPVGHVLGHKITFFATPERAVSMSLPSEVFDETRVDIVALYPGCDASLCEAAVTSGAQGIVLLGMGSGNGNHSVVSWVRRTVEQGIPVVLASRVPGGPVVPLYGNGGAVSLLSAGAVLAENLPATQVRVLMALLLSRGISVTEETIRRGRRG